MLGNSETLLIVLHQSEFAYRSLSPPPSLFNREETFHILPPPLFLLALQIRDISPPTVLCIFRRKKGNPTLAASLSIEKSYHFPLLRTTLSVTASSTSLSLLHFIPCSEWSSNGPLIETTARAVAYHNLPSTWVTICGSGTSSPCIPLHPPLSQPLTPHTAHNTPLSFSLETGIAVLPF